MNKTKQELKDEKHRMTYPETNEEIVILNYENLNIKVFNRMVQKFGPWLHRHRFDLLQTGYIGLIKAKEKYTPGRGSFVALAYLRIMSVMQNDIAKYAKFEMNTIPLEDVSGPTGTSKGEMSEMTWEDMFSGHILDYGLLLRMVEDADDQKVLLGIIEMYPYWKLRAIMNESKEDHEIRVARIKEELKELLEILHPNL